MLNVPSSGIFRRMPVSFPLSVLAHASRQLATIRTATSRNLFRRPLAQVAKMAVVCLLVLCAVANAHAQGVNFVSLQTYLSPGVWNNPTGIVTDSSGNIYVSDSATNKIIMVNAITHASSIYLSGALTCSSTLLTLTSPQGLAMDSSNNLYIANQYARLNISSGQIIVWNTVTNTCKAYYNNNAETNVFLDASNNIWEGGTCISRIPVGTPSGSTSISASTSGVGFEITNTCTAGASNVFYNLPAANTAHGFAIAPTTNSLWSVGDLLVSDGVSKIFRFTAASNFQTPSTVFSGLNVPGAILFDSSNNLVVALNGSSFSSGLSPTVAKYAAPNYSASTTVMTNSAYSAGMAQDYSGNLFIVANSGVAEVCSSGNCTIPSTNVGSSSPIYTATFQISTSGTKFGAINYFEQGVSGASSEFNAPATDSSTTLCTVGTTYGSQTNCSVDFVFSPHYPGSRYGALQLNDNSGNVLSTVYLNALGVGPELVYVPGKQTLVGTGNSAPYAAVADALGNVYLDNFANRTVVKVTPAGVQSSIPCCSGLTPSTLTASFNVAVDGAGNVYLSDDYNSSSGLYRLIKIPWNGTSYGNASVVPLTGYQGLVAIDGNGNIYGAGSNTTIIKYTPAGAQITLTCCSGLSPSTLSINSIQVDGAGNIYIADDLNHRVVKMPWNGSSYATPVNVGSNFNTPSGVAADAAGDIYVVDFANKNVTFVPWNGSSYGAQSVVASGFQNPYGVSVDAAGDIFVADPYANQVVKLSDGTAPTLTWATATSVGSTDTTDGSQTVTLQNIGNALLSIPTPTTGNNPSISSGYAYNNSSTCPQLSVVSSAATLAQGVNCTYVLDFTPAAVGTNSGSLVLTDNNLNTPATTQTIKLTGVGSAPVAALSTTSLNFSSQVSATTSAPLTVNLQNTGNAPLVIGSVSFTGTNAGDFVIASGTNTCTGTVAVNGTCSVGVAFAPTALGSRSATLNFTDNAPGSPQSVSLLGTGVAAGTQMDWGTLPATPILVNGNAGSAITVKEENASKVVVTTATDTITLTVTGPNSYSKTYTQAAVAGVATFNLGSAALPAAGTYTYTAAVTGLTSITATETVNLITPTLNWTPVAPTGGTVTGAGTSTVATIWNPTALGTLLNAYTSSPDTSTCAYTATPTGAAVTSTSVLAGGTYTLTVTCTPTGSSVGVYAPISSTITLQVNSETITLTPSSAIVQILGSVTLQATVAGNTGSATPTGTVTFYDGSTQLGSGTLVNGAFSITFAPALTASTGSHPLTVKYGGDGNYPTGTSSSVSEIVVGFTITCATPTSAYTEGQTVTISCTETPTTSTFPNAITLAGNLPGSGTNPSLTPAIKSILASPAVISAGSGTTPFTISIVTQKTPGASYRNPLLPFFALMLPALPFLGLLRHKLLRRTLTQQVKAALLLVTVLIGVVGLSGSCGESSCTNAPASPPCPATTTVNIVVSGTSGLLVVQPVNLLNQPVTIPITLNAN